MSWRTAARDNAVGGCVGGVVTAVPAAALALVPGAWAWVADSAAALWRHLGEPSGLSNWAVYLLTGWSGLALVALAAHIRDKVRTSDRSMFAYVEDTFFGVVCRRAYRRRTLIALAAFCPACDTQLVYRREGSYAEPRVVLYCEACRADRYAGEGSPKQFAAAVHRQIERKLRSGEWKGHAPRPPTAPG